MLSQADSRRATLFNILCAVLMLSLIVCQFLPFWHYGEEGSETNVSIQEYVWFPTDHKGLDTAMTERLGAPFSVNDILGKPILVLTLGTIGVVLCIWKHRAPWVGLLPVGCGLAGLWGYLGQPGMRMGSLWQLHLALCIAMMAVGAAELWLLRRAHAPAAAAA